MAVKIRLARAGAKKAPFYRVVAADSRAPRDGRFIEILGRYNPRTHPSTIDLNLEKIDAWLAKGAQPSETVAKLIAIAKNPQASVPTKETSLSKKAQAKVEADAKAAVAAAESAAKAVEAPVEEVAEQAADEAPVEEATEEAPVEEAPVEEAVADETESAPSEEAAE